MPSPNCCTTLGAMARLRHFFLLGIRKMNGKFSHHRHLHNRSSDHWNKPSIPCAWLFSRPFIGLSMTSFSLTAETMHRAPRILGAVLTLRGSLDNYHDGDDSMMPPHHRDAESERYTSSSLREGLSIWTCASIKHRASEPPHHLAVNNSSSK